MFGVQPVSKQMKFSRIGLADLALLVVAPASAQTSSEPVAEVANIRFYSNELLNLHHTLYAAAWALRTSPTEGRVLAQKLPHPLSASFTPQERHRARSYSAAREDLRCEVVYNPRAGRCSLGRPLGAGLHKRKSLAALRYFEYRSLRPGLVGGRGRVP